jgi:hypothetical protein
VKTTPHQWQQLPDARLPGGVAFRCAQCALTVWTRSGDQLPVVDATCPGPEATERQGVARMPSLAAQAWNLAGSLADFLADGCRTVRPDDYQRRLEICDGCDQRRGNRCLQCGCRLHLKARGRAFACPLNKWPLIEEGPSAQTP